MKDSYLIRFDDICPTMNWAVWEQVEKILVDLKIAPILAVIPDNRNEKLKFEKERTDFWEKVRTWKKRGWSIGLHGLHHQYCNKNAGLMKLNPNSEFAGLSRGEQEVKLHKAMQIFHDQGISPDIWIAPSHSFDRVTISILNNLGLRRVSDGYSLFPYVDAHGVMWVPQQLWKMRRRFLGVWTVCYHPNLWSQRDVNRFYKDVLGLRERITSLDTVTNAFNGRPHSVFDSIVSAVFFRMIMARRKIHSISLSYPDFFLLPSKERKH